MNIVTVFNYPDDTKYNILFKNWITQAIRCKLHSTCINNIIILTKKLNEQLENYINLLNCQYIKIKLCETFNLVNPPEHRWHHNVGFKLFNICNETEPYIYIDADAIFMTTMLDKIITASKDQPVIGVNHQTIPNHSKRFNFKFINTGFLIVTDPRFLNFHKILDTSIQYRCPGTDQLLIHNYFKTINYDYTHPLIHWGWNSCAGYKKLLDSGKIVSDGIVENHEVHVLHYWDEFKPWIRKCKIYDDLSKDIETLGKIYNHIETLDYISVIDLYFKCKKFDKCRLLCQNKDLIKDMTMVNLYGTTHESSESGAFDMTV